MSISALLAERVNLEHIPAVLFATGFAVPESKLRRSLESLLTYVLQQVDAMGQEELRRTPDTSHDPGDPLDLANAAAVGLSRRSRRPPAVRAWAQRLARSHGRSPDELANASYAMLSAAVHGEDLEEHPLRLVAQAAAGDDAIVELAVAPDPSQASGILADMSIDGMQEYLPVATLEDLQRARELLDLTLRVMAQLQERAPGTDFGRLKIGELDRAVLVMGFLAPWFDDGHRQRLQALLAELQEPD